ncbi:MAG: imidazole glycerol phosphate synthase subunit HisH [Candidatus Hodgkinia cicadicola]
MRVGIIDYGAGNLKSVFGMFKLAAQVANKPAADVVVTDDAKQVLGCDRIVLPGVGSFHDCYEKLSSLHSMLDVLDFSAVNRRLPILGICVGMQLMSSASLEEVKASGFNWIPGVVTRLPSEHVRVPHMGWNSICVTQKHYLFSGLPVSSVRCNVYFAHSYQYKTCNASSVLATTCYGGKITAAVAASNVVGVQFHPEKSSSFGLTFCKNFLHWQVAF